jgi:hypothetical protein
MLMSYDAVITEFNPSPITSAPPTRDEPTTNSPDTGMLKPTPTSIVGRAIRW